MTPRITVNGYVLSPEQQARLWAAASVGARILDDKELASRIDSWMYRGEF